MSNIPYYKGKPSVTLQLQDYRKQWRYFRALLDSGADFSIFPSGTAITLGIKTKKLKRVQLEAADGHVFNAYHTLLSAKLYSIILPLRIGFVENPHLTPVIGRAGFFENFKVEFNEIRQLVKLTPF